MTGEDEEYAERLMLKLRKMGKPGSRENWQIVVACLIGLTDGRLQAVAQKGRTVGVSWIVPVAEAILEELQAGRAYRADDGAITLRERPQAKGLQVLL